MRNHSKTLSDQSLDAVSAYCGRYNPFADRDTQPSVVGLPVFPVDRKPVDSLRPLFQYPRKTIPTRQAIAPGKSFNFY
jgi:hypothetical protein